eukprot:TRINITY_DN4830_c0_g1_i1.p1 TRINITY_DN4830_c0_g1~~TRINITY_DN4830_c0_g1_i1.p1  ORF type:complete len:256 (-),score=30.06 TRINITY_DN4830_c0_g1_i1:125-892(-)
MEAAEEQRVQELVQKQITDKSKRSIDLKSKRIHSLNKEYFSGATGNIESVDLCGNFLAALDNDLFQHIFQHLTIINLLSNELTTVPKFDNLPNLRELYLGKNKISSLSNLEGFSQLEVLDLRANKLESVSELTLCPNLTKLSLSSNKLKKLVSLPPLPKLTSLFLFGNYLDDEEDCINALARVPFLETVILSANPVYPLITPKEGPIFMKREEFRRRIIGGLSRLKNLDWQPVNTIRASTTTTTQHSKHDAMDVS